MRAAGRRRGPLGDRAAVGLVGCFLMLQPMSTDFYLASLPGLTQTFAASVATVQLTLSVFIIAFGMMQLVIGPLSDRLGRYPVTIAGIALYAAASVACALAPSIEWLILARFFQAIGCCTAVVVARAVVRDVFDPLAGAKVLAQASTLLAIGPLFGPILGSFLEVRFGFRAIFAVAGGLFRRAARRHPRPVAGDQSGPRRRGDAPGSPPAQLRAGAALAPVPELRAGGRDLVRGPVRVHIRVPVRADPRARRADRVFRFRLRLLRRRLPHRHHRLPPPARPPRDRAHAQGERLHLGRRAA